MDSIWIQGGKPLNGDIQISGAKNSALTLLPCALLTAEPLTLGNLPRLADVDSFGHLLNELGVSTRIAGARRGEITRRMTLTADDIISTVAPYDMVRKMRASILVLGPMLARMGESTVSLPGGCAIGDRPIDLHLKALEAMGATIEIAAGYVKASAPKGRLPGGDFSFPFKSLQKLNVFGEFLFQDFDGNHAAVLLFFGEMNRRHPAVAEDAFDRVAIA